MKLSEEQVGATDPKASFALEEFSRFNKGLSESVTHMSVYRYPTAIAEDTRCSMVVEEEYAVIHIPAQTLKAFSVRIDDRTFQQRFISMMTALDTAAARGGRTLEGAQRTFYFTSDAAYNVGGTRYVFSSEPRDGKRYTEVITQTNEANRPLFYLEAAMTNPAEVVPASERSMGEKVREFFSTMDYRPLWVSLKTGTVATLIVVVLGLLVAWRTVAKDGRTKGALDSFLTIPLVLPPTVCGFVLLLLFGNSTPVGRWLLSHDIELIFSWPATVLAATVVAFPLMYRTARGAFENLDLTMLDAARVLGWSEQKIFVRLMLPLTWPSVAAGIMLAFIRALGEFGATLFVAGNYAGITQTIPIAIYFQWMGGNTNAALFWTAVIVLVAFFAIAVINFYASKSQEYRTRGSR